MKQIRRIVLVVCPDCLGTGRPNRTPCHTCQGTGEIERVVVEFVPDDNAPVAK